MTRMSPAPAVVRLDRTLPAPPERVADPAHDSRLTVTLRAAPGGTTELALVHERLEAIAAAMPGMADMVAAGWAQALEGLARALDTTG